MSLAPFKKCLLLGRWVMTNLDSILKRRDINLPTKVRLVKAMVFPVVVYGCESWTIMKAVLRSHLTPLPLVVLSTPWALSRLAGWTPSNRADFVSKFHHPFFRIIKIKSVGSPENWRGPPRAVLGFVGDTQRQTNRAAGLGPEGPSQFRSLLVFDVLLDHDVPCMSAGRLHS